MENSPLFESESAAADETSKDMKVPPLTINVDFEQLSSDVGTNVSEEIEDMEVKPTKEHLNDVVLNTDNVETPIEVNCNDSKKIVRRSSIAEVQEMMQTQDCKQITNMSLTLVLEVYRVLMGTLLVFVVPQDCGDEACSMQERFYFSDIFSQFTIGFNFFTLLSFLMLYVVEVKREYKMITYLEVNRFLPRDNESVGEALEKLHPTRLTTLFNYDKAYMYAGYGCILAYIINIALSLGVIEQRVLNSTTYTVLLTNVLFMSSKLANVYQVAHTKPNIFLSSYLTRKIQYNDVDPDKLINNEPEEEQQLCGTTKEVQDEDDAAVDIGVDVNVEVNEP